MNQRVLTGTHPHAEDEEAQLVVPTHERRYCTCTMMLPPLHITGLMVPYRISRNITGLVGMTSNDLKNHKTLKLAYGIKISGMIRGIRFDHLYSDITIS
ncbi:hypothetical protein TNCV_3943001 [Trichonephila clavipes]|nr:hypothetical protein TNCV_3943001 [Trichonephila clavipes]